MDNIMSSILTRQLMTPFPPLFDHPKNSKKIDLFFFLCSHFLSHIDLLDVTFYVLFWENLNNFSSSYLYPKFKFIMT